MTRFFFIVWLFEIGWIFANTFAFQLNSIRNIGYLGIGYDATMGRPITPSSTSDPGYKSNIFEI